MTETPDLGAFALEAVHNRLTRIFPSQIRSAVEELTEEQLWWRPNEKSNSVGNLVLHLSGSVRHYIAHKVGGMDYRRDRPAEFSERGPLPKEELLAIFGETVNQAAEALDSLDLARMLEPTDEPHHLPTLFDLLLNVTVHVASHTGQILYVAKMLKEGSLDEVWIKSHLSVIESREVDGK